MGYSWECEVTAYVPIVRMPHKNSRPGRRTRGRTLDSMRLAGIGPRICPIWKHVTARLNSVPNISRSSRMPDT